MIEQIHEIPITKESYPFSSAYKYCDFKHKQYIEKEYFMDGTSNVYQSIGNTGEVKIKYRDVSYRNRMIVRMPQDIKKASGNVVVEIINPTSFMEIERMWILAYEKFMRDGDIYVGITSKPNTIGKLMEFDENRYASLSWPNPNKEPFEFDLEDMTKKHLIPDLDIHYETGLFWDMLTDLNKLLRKNEDINPIHAYPHSYIYLTGWSQSACYLFRYLNSFRKEKTFDGYLAGGGIRNLIVPVNQYESCMDYDFRLRRVEYCPEPLISMQTESENGQFDAFRTKRNDSDNPDFLYREYEVTGSSHDTMYSYVNYYQNDEDLKRIHMLPSYIGKHKEGNDYPSQILFAAAFRNLFNWVRNGVGPQSCPRIQMEFDGSNAKDAFGNTIGGLRTCLLNYPTTRYCATSQVEIGQSFVDPTSDQDPLFGYQKAFSPTLLQELYGSLSNYEKLCRKDTKKQVSKGFVCREDAEKLVQYALNVAKKRGLK
ncbi:alpha/beta hydrolase domain-containing protein [Floccifex sp.]|uniref:alpha/beta hydrolase domain-containing protein n=1 Tax=Floccifex sp. TaxID=2815810 RepID=UPI003EFC974E